MPSRLPYQIHGSERGHACSLGRTLLTFIKLSQRKTATFFHTYKTELYLCSASQQCSGIEIDINEVSTPVKQSTTEGKEGTGMTFVNGIVSTHVKQSTTEGKEGAGMSSVNAIVSNRVKRSTT